MLVGGDAYFNGRIDSALLRYWADWQKRKKSHEKLLQRLVSSLPVGSVERTNAIHRLAVVKSEIKMLRMCIDQVHACQQMQKQFKKRPDLFRKRPPHNFLASKVAVE